MRTSSIIYSLRNPFQRLGGNLMDNIAVSIAAYAWDKKAGLSLFI